MILDSPENKRKILESFLQLCAFDGVSEETLEKSLEKCQISPKYKNLIFENGVLDLIEFYIEEILLNLEKNIQSQPDFANFKIRDKIKFALYDIFEQQKPHQLAISRINNFYLDIKNLTNCHYGVRPATLPLKNSMKLADGIWRNIGDKSTDFNFYTKRLTLSKIIILTFAQFIKDETLNLEKTKKFIDLEIEKVMKFEKFKAKVKNFTKDSSQVKQKLHSFFHDQNNDVKSPKDLLKKLPFIRLFQ